MNAITHPVETEQLMAFVDGELTAAEAQQVSAHIADCTECASLTAELRATSSAVAEWRVAVVPKSVEESVASYAARANLGLRISGRGFGRRTDGWWSRKRWVILSGAVATVGMMAMFSFMMFRQPERVAGGLQSRRVIGMMRLEPVEPKDAPIEGQSAGGGNGLSAKNDALESAPPAKSIDGQSAGDQASTHDGPELPLPASPATDSNGAVGGVIGGNPGQIQAQQSAEAPMIARTVSLTIVVKDFVAARSSLDAILARHQGYAAQMNVSTPEGSARSLQASLCVRAPMLAAAVADLKTLGRVEIESQSGEEVTRQHEDLLARLKTARETEERFRAILNQRTGTVSDVLQVEEGIARVRGEIEQMEAEQNALEHRVDFATIELQLTEEYKAELNAPESAGTRMHNAFVAGFQNVGGSLFSLILFLEEYGPVLLIWAAILAVPIIFLRRRYRKALATTR